MGEQLARTERLDHRLRARREFLEQCPKRGRRTIFVRVRNDNRARGQILSASCHAGQTTPPIPANSQMSDTSSRLGCFRRAADREPGRSELVSGERDAFAGAGIEHGEHAEEQLGGGNPLVVCRGRVERGGDVRPVWSDMLAG